jgi:PEP-CTERM motif-containing protein
MKMLSVRNLFLSLVVSAVLSTSAWASPVPFNGHYYDVIRAAGITWNDARAAALSQFFLSLQGHLVTITSAGEDTAVHNMILTNGGGEMWAGGYQNPVTETNPFLGWTWVNGEGTFPGVSSASPFANWSGGEPNDFYGPASEQYLGLNFGTGWNDEGNLSLITGYVIEYDPNTINDVVPEPISLTLVGTGILGLVARHRRRSL